MAREGSVTMCARNRRHHCQNHPALHSIARTAARHRPHTGAEWLWALVITTIVALVLAGAF